MKYLARLTPNESSQIVSIYEVIKKQIESPETWDKRTYYSLWKYTPMIARVPKKRKPHFAFKNGQEGNQDSGGGESIEHQLAKKMVFDQKSIFLKKGMGNNIVSDIIKLSNITIEKSFEEGKYRVDLYGEINSENVFELPTGSYIAIEFQKTSKVSKVKQKFCRENNITCVEIKLWEKIRYEDDLDLLMRQLKGYFRIPLFFKWIHNPNYKQSAKQKETVNKANQYTNQLSSSTVKEKVIVKIENKRRLPNDIQKKQFKELKSHKKKKTFFQRIFQFLFGEK